jgi:hypothetical protein
MRCVGTHNETTGIRTHHRETARHAWCRALAGPLDRRHRHHSGRGDRNRPGVLRCLRAIVARALPAPAMARSLVSFRVPHVGERRRILRFGFIRLKGKCTLSQTVGPPALDQGVRGVIVQLDEIPAVAQSEVQCHCRDSPQKISDRRSADRPAQAGDAPAF